MTKPQPMPLTCRLRRPPHLIAGAAVVGKKEGEGPLGERFDAIYDDAYLGQKSWEQAESQLFTRCFECLRQKASLSPGDLDVILAGDLLAQCSGSCFGLKDTEIPFLGLYGACSTMAESLALAALLLDGGHVRRACAITGSHYCSAERQFRTPLEYGAQRAPTAQWTVTGAGGLILSAEGSGPRVTAVTLGRMVDGGVTDAANMGAAMAPAAADTIAAHLRRAGCGIGDYDAIITGDLGLLGHELLTELLAREQLRPPHIFTDCGLLIYRREGQDVHCGGSGCGCSAAVLCGHILKLLQSGHWQRVLFAATGALMSATTALQGQSIPGICHAVTLEADVPDPDAGRCAGNAGRAKG